MRCVIVATVLLSSFGCSGSGGGAGSGFALIQFLESGKDSIARNRALTFRFSSPVDPNQDFFERLKIQNVQTANGQSDFTRARGAYVINGDTVVFVPLLPNKEDRSDSGFLKDANYHVFLKGGPDALHSMNGASIPLTQEFLFDTDQYFDDPVPGDPPRALRLLARDPTTGGATDVSRLDPDPAVQAQMASADVLAAGNVIDPGAGGAPNYATPWQFELHMTEPLDPLTVNTDTVQLFEIRNNAINGTETQVRFKVPILVDLVQDIDPQGDYAVYVRVRPIQTLVDNARYEMRFSGTILGIDFRQQFIGDNGLTGDGLAGVEPGGLGYVTQFLVHDRPAITASRAVLYEPSVDGILPEAGQTTDDESMFNTSLYDPLTDPGKAVGYLPDFGDGSDGPLAVSGGNTTTLDTGDVPNTVLGNPFTVQDMNPDDVYNKTDLSSRTLTFDSHEPYELSLESLTISSSSTLRITGVNPVLLRVIGVVDIRGTLDASGEDGQAGSGGTAKGGAAGPGGGAGGESRRGHAQSYHTHNVYTWANLLSFISQIKQNGPYSDNGQGPGRGLRGAESFNYTPCNDAKDGTTGTGGGGASHALAGTYGEDRLNAGGATGTPGPALPYVHCNSKGGFKNESVIGMRGVAGSTYGDRAVLLNTWGGSGGGAGGNAHGNYRASGGGGGGGGGSLTILAGGPIIATGGVITVRGGDGGKGFFGAPNSSYGYATGGGGGGSGGTLVLVSGSDINLTGTIVDAAGGAGGARGDATSSNPLPGPNAGGDGGGGFIFLMDSDGLIDGYIHGAPGDYDTPDALIRVSAFDGSRFSSIAAVTELFPMPAANPVYQPLDPAGVLGQVSPGQSIAILMSTSYANPDDPLRPDLTPGMENVPVHVATISFAGGGTSVTLEQPMSDLNPFGTPQREAFLRVRGNFHYTDATEAALGPFASIDAITIDIMFNG